jgi:hypothetical protein
MKWLPFVRVLKPKDEPIGWQVIEKDKPFFSITAVKVFLGLHQSRHKFPTVRHLYLTDRLQISFKYDSCNEIINKNISTIHSNN